MMQPIFKDNQKRVIKGKEDLKFLSYSSFHLTKLTARAKGKKQLSPTATDDEDLTVKLDDRAFPKLDESTRSIDSPAAFSGGSLHNLSKTIYFLTFLKGQDHHLTLSTDAASNSATFEGLEVYSLDLSDRLAINIQKQAEDGDGRPWLTVVLNDLPLVSFTPSITYSHRKRDSDDVKIIVDGKTWKNPLRTIKHFLWWFVGSVLPERFPERTETEVFEVNLTKGNHYLEFHADRKPLFRDITLNFGEIPIPPSGIPTSQDPKWTGDFFDDTEVMLLARTIYGEVGGEPYEVKVAVGWSIKNRVEDTQNRWGRTYHEVILAEAQYDALWNKWTFEKVRNPPIESDNKEKKAWLDSFDVAGKVIGNKILDPTKGANHFYSTSIPRPDWADEEKRTLELGSTRFYKL